MVLAEVPLRVYLVALAVHVEVEIVLVICTRYKIIWLLLVVGSGLVVWTLLVVSPRDMIARLLLTLRPWTWTANVPGRLALAITIIIE